MPSVQKLIECLLLTVKTCDFWSCNETALGGCWVVEDESSMDTHQEEDARKRRVIDHNQGTLLSTPNKDDDHQPCERQI